MKPGDLRRFKNTHSRYPGAIFMVLEVLDLAPGASTQKASVTFLVNGQREFGWNDTLLKHVSEVVTEAQ